MLCDTVYMGCGLPMRPGMSRCTRAADSQAVPSQSMLLPPAHVPVELNLRYILVADHDLVYVALPFHADVSSIWVRLYSLSSLRIYIKQPHTRLKASL